MVTMRRIVDQEGADFYPTPPWATKALLENEKFEGNIWEPACGNGAMSEEIKKRYPCQVYSTDLYDHGYEFAHTGINFLMTYNAEKQWNNIITNPPYNEAENFIHKALSIVNHKAAFLLRLSFLEGEKRYKRLFAKSPPVRVWAFSERITFYPAGAEIKGSGTLAYGWFIWDNRFQDTKMKTELCWFPPNYKPKKLRKKKKLVNSEGLEPSPE